MGLRFNRKAAEVYNRPNRDQDFRLQWPGAGDVLCGGVGGLFDSKILFMRAFKKIMLLTFEPVPEHGIYGDSVNSSPWLLTIRVVDWWGLRDRIVKAKVQVPFSCDVYKFYETKINVWL